MSIYVGAGRINYPAMRGPCPYGYHMPFYNDFVNIHNIGVSLGAWGDGGEGENVLLKIPLAGYRDAGNSSAYSQGGDGICRCSDAYSTQARRIGYGSRGIALDYISWRGMGASIRPFKDVPEIPTSSWTKLYGTSIESGGIFWNSSAGLISISSNGQDWITIADKNLGATTVWNSGDTLSEANCGKYFQRGNNYPFSRAGSITNSTTKVDASNYGPGNWYYNSTFIRGGSSPYDRSSVQNDNLRGGVVGKVKADVKDICVGAGVDDKSPAQGPCPDGFHVPIWGDWGNIVTAGVTLGAWTSKGGNNFSTYMKLPLSGYRSGDSSTGSKSDSGTYGNYWYNTNTSSTSFSYLRFSSSTLAFNYSWDSPCHGLSIRPFKNNPVVPDSTWTVLYQGTGNAGIYWSKGLGLISISKDGTTWYTIADKNLGAKKVWNSGDTLNEDNCGGYFQYGNNYMFPYSGNLSGSTTKVDVIGFGPGNYYMDSQRRYNRDGSWMSQWNGDLRGCQTGKQKKGNVKQVYVGTTPVRPTYNPGIYWNKAKGLISISSNGKNWITMADKNLGAKVVYNAGDTLSQDNCGLYYQWGNNYGFAWTGSVTTSSTQVNASSYGPGNYYSSSTFIKGNSDWSSVKNDNLWGNTTNTLIARQGPCPAGFHIPTRNDWDNLISSATSIGVEQKGGVYTNLFKLPRSGNRSYSGGGISDQNVSGQYLTSTPVNTNVYMLDITANVVGTNYGYTARATGNSIRPFKNEPVVPDNSRAVLYKPS